MKLDYDKEVDAAYIYLVCPIKKGQAKQSVELDENIVLDLDSKGKLLGVEILNASKVVNRKALLRTQAA